MPGVISSRTPEGNDNHCPLCGADVRIEPSLPSGDAPCPNCGSLLWFYAGSESARLYERSAIESLRDRLRAIIARQLGVDIERVTEASRLVHDLGADSLDLVELVMELDEEFEMDLDVATSEVEAPAITTVAGILDYYARRRE